MNCGCGISFMKPSCDAVHLDRLPQEGMAGILYVIGDTEYAYVYVWNGDSFVLIASPESTGLISIDAVFTQGGAIIYDTDSLDSLKQYLVVTANYSDSTSEIVPSTDYTLSGALEVGTSTITVTYSGKTDTFAVVVSDLGIDLSNVEEYFKPPVISAMQYVQTLGTEDWVHHIVITDTHFVKNYGHSTAIVKAMQDTGYFGKVIHLGDITDDATQANIEASVDNYGQFNGDLLYAIGNHDVMFTGYESYWYNNLLSDDTDIDVTDIANFNYYFDDTVNHIRYIVYGYSTASGGKTYAIDKIKSAPSGYAVITICHYKELLKSDILLPLIGHEVEYIGNITGHYHVDGYGHDFADMYNETWLNNDGWINDDANYPKTDGTDDSQAITIMSINTSTRNVKFYRIGIPTALGQNWQYTYVKGGSVEEWLAGMYWGTGTTTANANAAIYTKPIPFFDDQENELQYTVYANSGRLTNIYHLAIDENGDWITNRRESVAASDIWNRQVGLSKVGYGSAPVVACLLSVRFADIEDVTDLDDIVVASGSIPLGRSYSQTTWETGYYLNGSGQNVTDTDSATTYAFDVLPSTTYKFTVDDADWAGSTYMYAFTYKKTFVRNGARQMSRRLPNSSGSKTITFTTNANEYYCRISVAGLATVTDFASKCTLEIVP